MMNVVVTAFRPVANLLFAPRLTGLGPPRLAKPFFVLVTAWLVVLGFAQTSNPPVKWHSDGWTNAHTSYSRNGSTLLVWNANGFGLYNAKTGAEIGYAGLPAATGIMTAACVSNDGSTVYYGTNFNENGPGGLIVIYDVATATVSEPSVFDQSSKVWTAMCVSDDGTMLAAITSGNTVLVYNLKTSTVVNTFGVSLTGDGSADRSIHFVNSGKSLVFDGPTIYNVTGSQLGSISNTGYPVAVSPDERTVFSLNGSGGVLSLNAYSTSSLSLVWSDPISVSGSASGPAVSSDGDATFLGAATAGSWQIQGYSASSGQALPSGFQLSVPTASGSDLPSICMSPTANVALLGPGSQREAVAGFVTLDTQSGLGQASTQLFEGSVAANTVYNSYWSWCYSVMSSAGALFVADDEHDSGAFTTLRTSSAGALPVALPTSDALVSPDSKYYMTVNSFYQGTLLNIYDASSGELKGQYKATQLVGGDGYGWGPTSSQFYVLEYKQGTTGVAGYLESFDGSTVKTVATIPNIAWSSSPALYSGDGTLLASIGLLDKSKNVQVFNAGTGKETAVIDADTSSEGIARIDHAQKTWLGLNEIVGSVNEYRVFDISGSPKLVRKISYSLPPGVQQTDGTISPDGRYIAMEDMANPSVPETRALNEILLYRVSDGALLKTWSPMCLPGGYPEARICFSADSSVLAFQSGGAMYGFALPPTQLSLTVSPGSVPGGTSATGTVTLDSAADVATIVVLSSSSKYVTVPATVTIGAGSKSATFTVTTSGVDASTAGSIAASADNGVLKGSATLTVAPATALIPNLSAASVIGGNSLTGNTVTLNAEAGPSGVTVNLTASPSGIVTFNPTSITVAPNQSVSPTFTIATTNPSATTTVTVSATATPPGGAPQYSGSAPLIVNQAATVQLVFNPPTVIGGNATTMTISQSSAAPGGGSTYALTATPGSVVAVPATVTVPAGQKAVAVPIPSTPVSANTTVTVSATANGSVVASGTLTVSAPVVTSVLPTVTTVIGPATAYALVVINGPAPAGFSVAGSSNNPTVISVPASNPFATGLTYAFVPLTISAVTKQTAVKVTIGGKSFTITVLP